MVDKLQNLVKDDIQQINMVNRVLRYIDDEDYNMDDFIILKKEYQRYVEENAMYLFLFISEEKNILAHIRELKDADYDGYIPAVKVDNPTPICIYYFI